MAVFPVEGGPSSRGSSSLTPAHSKPGRVPGPRTGFRCGYSVYQAEYSRNLLFRCGGQMEDLFNRVLDRTRSRLVIPVLRTIFGLKARAYHNHWTGRRP